MIDAHDFLRNLALVLCVAAFTAVLFQRLRLPVVFGFLVAGMVVGPHLPVPLVADERMVHALSELGVILLMYSLGLEFSVRRCVQIGATAGVAALAETAMMFGLGYSVGALFGWTTVERIFAGGIVAISSTTIIARTFAEQNIQGRLREIVFGILIVEDLIAILLIAVLSAIAAGDGVSISALGMTGVRLATFLALLIAVGLFVLPRVMRMVIKLDRSDTAVIAAVGICFAAALLALSFGYSVALGAFIAGSLVAESGHGHRVEKLIEPIRDMFVAIFFVAVGMLIDPAMVAANWQAVLVLSILVIGGKIIAVSMGVFLSGNGLRNSVRTGMSLAQIGEFSFIIAGVGLATGAIRPFLYPVAIAASAITTLTTPFLVSRADKSAQFVDRKLPRALQNFAVLYTTWIEELRTRSAVPDGHLRVQRLVRMIVLDFLLLVALIIGASAERGRLAVMLQEGLGWSVTTSQYVLIGIAIAAAFPILVGLVRVTRALASVLALRALPAPSTGLDRAYAPRRALIATLQFGVLLGAILPVLALLQALFPIVPALTLLVPLVLMLGFAVWRSAGNLYGHTRAGAEVIVMALLQHDRAHGTEEQLTQTMEHMSTMLPGLGHPGAVRLAPSSPAVGRTLREIDLRASTGATVLAITRTGESGAEAIVPSGNERLRAGDLLALAGTEEGVAAARRALAGTELLAIQDAMLQPNSGVATALH